MDSDFCPAAFPGLTDDEMTCLAKLGTQRTFRDGEALITAGDRDFSFFAIQNGEVAIIDRTAGTPRDIVVHGPRAFTGDVAMLTGQPSIVSAIARGACETIEIAAPQVRRMLREVPGIGDKLLDAFQTRRKMLEAAGFTGIRVVGSQHSKETLELREFFYKNKVPHTFLDIELESGIAALEEFGARPDETPIIACTEHVVKRPSLATVAECLGITRHISNELFDILIIGAGPAGLAAAVYSASEGLRTLLVDRMGPGGQAGQSSKIENYMGFPSGILGTELANRGYLQALKFGAQFTAPVSVHSMRPNGGGEHHVEFCTGQTVRTRAVLVASGVSYRRLPVTGCDLLEGVGVYYAATTVEARICQDSTAIVVGGGNSAGQAAMFLSTFARQVKLLLRGGDLGKGMSDYLARRIEGTPNIEVLRHTEVDGLTGDGHLAEVRLRHNKSGESMTMPCHALFVFVGARPHTEWMPDTVALDERGFVLTGPALRTHEKWRLKRDPCELETTSPGVFAAGDVRAGTTKRCAFAVGDGALAVTCVHDYLAS